MKAEISFDLVIEEKYVFRRGLLPIARPRLVPVHVPKISRHGNDWSEKDLVWESGVTGVNIIVPDDAELNKRVVMTALASELGVTEWSEIRGPDSMQLR